MPSAINTAYSSLPFAVSLIFHIIVGSLGIYFYWRTILSAKGSPIHRRTGKRFFVVMVFVALSVGPMLFTRPGDFNPASVVQFVYLAICLTGAVYIGWSSIRMKKDLARFRGWPFRAYGFAMTGTALVVLAAGIATHSLLTASFSLIGLIVGPSILRFAYMKAEPHARWHITWHTTIIATLFNAVHANILAVIYEHTIDPTVGDAGILTTFYLTGIVAIGLRIWIARRFDAPIRFTLPPSGLVVA